MYKVFQNHAYKLWGEKKFRYEVYLLRMEKHDRKQIYWSMLVLSSVDLLQGLWIIGCEPPKLVYETLVANNIYFVAIIYITTANISKTYIWCCKLRRYQALQLIENLNNYFNKSKSINSCDDKFWYICFCSSLLMYVCLSITFCSGF